MAGKSDYLENKILDHVFGATAYTAPGTLYFALFTTAPTEAGTGGVEVSGSGYTRRAVTNNTTNFGSATSGQKTNATAIDWAAAGASWGTIVAFGIYDAASAGNLLYFGNLTTSRLISTGDIPRFAAGAFVVNED